MKNSIDKFEGRLFNLEITECSILADYEEAVARIHELKKLGIKVMIDDFGTGYSSLGRLRDLEINKIKIDKSFLAHANEDEKSEKIFESIFSLARTLDIEVVAEGLERMEQLKFLRKFTPMLTQGYFLQRPAQKDHLLTQTEMYTLMKGS